MKRDISIPRILKEYHHLLQNHRMQLKTISLGRSQEQSRTLRRDSYHSLRQRILKLHKVLWSAPAHARNISQMLCNHFVYSIKKTVVNIVTISNQKHYLCIWGHHMRSLNIQSCFNIPSCPYSLFRLVTAYRYYLKLSSWQIEHLIKRLQILIYCGVSISIYYCNCLPLPLEPSLEQRCFVVCLLEDAR